VEGGAAISERLRQIIAEEIRAKGPLPFARFMEHCLYHPLYGYYAAGRGRRGREGDYYTSPTVHPIFGALMGRQLVQMWRVLGADAFEIVEIGGAEGYLCLDILNYLQQEEPQFYDLLLYRMVEVSPVVIERQRRLRPPTRRGSPGTGPRRWRIRRSRGASYPMSSSIPSPCIG
jgi:SAM-dependent MidA family methyltransferase